MPNFYEYLKWRGDLEFSREPFNPVDNAIFSQLSYLPMEGIVPEPGDADSVSIEEAGKLFAKEHKKYLSGNNPDVTITYGVNVLQAIKDAPRYKDCRLFGFVNNVDFIQEKQFSAYCIKTEKKKNTGGMFVVFRGTDMNLAGWKEDFNMSFKKTVPAQREAVVYLEKMAKKYSEPLIIAGHSKGGNLAVYASAFCNKNVQKRISKIFCNDSPGFQKEIIRSREYKAICARIYSFIPQGSFVGMLLEHGEIPYVVKSNAIGFFQHNMDTWEVMHNNFVRAKLTQHSIFINKVLHEWLYQIDESQREIFIGTLYDIITSGNAQSLTDFPADWKNTAVGMINSIKNMDKDTKKLLLKIFANFYKTYYKNIGENLGNLLPEKLKITQ
ncbi:MAG: DUF2974 domain-containing protein [Treponema sp.]|nr:DUF2974 domain-containing protein [Treponema sp.]